MRVVETVLAAVSLMLPPTASGHSAVSQKLGSDSIPVDSSFLTGSLPNGLRYYVRRNTTPAKHAEFRLVVNAGSVQETDAEGGVAHMIEHMAFEGTTHFGRNELTKYLHAIGAQYGPDVNAATSFDETVYELGVPTDDRESVDRALTILEDWAHGITFDTTALKVERSVVLEELRSGNAAADRLNRQVLLKALPGSPYARRLPIGSAHDIATVTAARLRGYYDRWYRPNLMAIVAVGDLDPAAVVEGIRSRFRGLTNPPDAPPRTVIQLAGNDAPVVAVASDKEASQGTVALMVRVPHPNIDNARELRRSLAERLYFSMFSARLANRALESSPPFSFATASRQAFFSRGVDVMTLNAEVSGADVGRALGILAVEAKRAQMGFLPTEIERAKRNLTRDLEQAGQATMRSSVLARSCVESYLTGDALLDAGAVVRVARSIIPGMTAEEIRLASPRWLDAPNRMVIAEVPAAGRASAPTESTVRRVLASAIEQPVRPYVDRHTVDALIGETPPPGMITAESTFRDAGITEWRLSNGARVLLKPTKSGDNTILFNAWAPRGTWQALPGEAASARYASDIAAASGLGALSNADLRARLKNTTAKIEALIAPTSTLLQGEAQPDDISTLMELIYLTFTAPRVDSAGWRAVRDAEAEALRQAEVDPDAAFEEGADSLLARYNLRDSPTTRPQLSEVDPARARSFYRRTFADPSIFTFVFVGPFNQRSLKPLVERYLATLPHASSVSLTGAHPASYPTTVASAVISKGIEQRSQTRLVFADSSANTPAEDRLLNALAATLQLQLDAVIRERLGLAYSPHAEVHTAPNLPYAGYEVTVDYGSSPSRVDETTNRILGLIRSLQEQGPSAAEVSAVQHTLIHEYATDSGTSAFWLGNITAHVALGQSVESVAIDERPRIEELTRDALRGAARRYLSTTRYFKVTLYPGGKR